MITRSQIKTLYENIDIEIANIQLNPIQKHFDNLKDALNGFFNDSKCLGVIYTNNQDKLFFGTYIMPKISADDVIRTITTDKKYLIKEYYVELDSKLFSVQFNLTHEEITALLVHDIGALVNNSAPSEIVVKNIDQYLVDNHESLKLSDVVHYKEILSFGFRDAIRKLTSIFEQGAYNKSDDTLADFIDWTDYVGHIISGLTKLDRQGQLFFNREVDNKFITMSWILRIYKNIVGYRLSVNKIVEKCKTLSPSQIEIKELNNLVRRVNRIDDDMLLESYDEVEMKKDPLLEEIRLKTFPNKYSHDDCFRIFKNDVIDKTIRQENMIDEDINEVPHLIHNINNSLSLVKDYVNNNITDKSELKQWRGMYNKLLKTRTQLSKHKLFVPDRKMVNIWNNNCGGR